MELKIIDIEKPEEMNFILGHSHFIKTVEDLHEAIVNVNPSIEFGLAFCEASQDALVRYSGNNEELIIIAQKNAMNLGAGHSFIIFLGNAFPINILNTIKNVPEVTRVFCATSNPTQVIIAETEQGRAILGVVDGIRTKGIETVDDIEKRRKFLRAIGYKF
ncbi:MAG: adenosine-specific kinase [Calditrichaceae bacterium]|nr:adenosine-specific kinase [Calditrichaceae bacterium]MBN2708774.1 adenosine-specific kinase [Calditrichaceae bacterium]RQV97695.1 MAG: hypothetical protein EH224_01365 [Calditrichota bacterium]